MKPVARRQRRNQEGQAIVLLAVGLVALLAMVSLVIDGGTAFAQQRQTQNAADASAEAGAVVLEGNVAAQNNGATVPYTDEDVLNAVDAKAASNGIATPTAYYTTIDGSCILQDGSTAPQPCTSQPDAVQVGSGSIPTVNADSNGNAQCPIPPGSDAATTPAPACGVVVYGTKSASTHFGGVFSLLPGGSGIFGTTTSAQATAAAGMVTQICGSDQPCGFLPVTFPTSLTLCDGTGKQLAFGQQPYAPSSNEVIIPLCKTANGSVGWLAIQPEDNACGGGVNDLACDIQTPDNPALNLPVWIGTETGNTNSTQINTAVNSYDGQQVVIPLYDCVANPPYVSSQVSPGPACPTPAVTGVGSNTYYRIVGLIGFKLDRAYINASNPQCNELPGSPFVGGNGSTGCLKGWIVQVSLPAAQIGTGNGAQGSAFGVQLIR